MVIGEAEIEQRMRRLERACRSAGVKLTPQRIEVFRELARSGEHPDVEAILRGVRERMPTVSQDTVYRTLWLLAELDLITTLGPGRRRTRFDANLERHHHFVCIDCGLTRDFYSEALDELALPESASAFGRVETTQVEARGICQACETKERRERGTAGEET